MSREIKMKNCVVALVTPMHENGTVDYPSFSALIDWHLSSGTEALVILGTTGEAPTLTHEEKITLIKTTIAHVNKRIPVIVGTGSYDTRTTVALSQEAESLGADGLLIIAPYYNKPTQNGIYLHFKTVNDAVNIPIILYNHPGRTGSNMEIDTIHQLSQLKNIIGLKDTHPDVTRISSLKKLCGDAFWLWSSCDDNSVDYVKAGGDGVISVIANIMPREMKQLMHYALQKDVNATDELHKKLMPLINALNLESNPIPVKYALFLMQKIPCGIRLPLTILEKPHQEILEKTLKDTLQ